MAEPVRQYSWLQENLYSKNVARDREFQRRFNHFYRVRYPQCWQKYFFGMLERHKNKTPRLEFKDALRQLYQNTGRLEASFASKLVATIDTQRPVIDRHLLKHANLRLPWYGAVDREAKIVDLYRSLTQWISELRHSECGHKAVAGFTERFPPAGISETKILDLIFWQMRDPCC